jgi:hypothetical protein
MPQTRSSRSISGFDLRHDCKGSAVRIRKECHPLFRSIAMAVHKMWRVGKLDSTSLEFGICPSDILHAKIEQGLSEKHGIRFTQKKPNTIAIEKRQLAEGVQVFEAEDSPIPSFRLRDVAHRTRNLPDTANQKWLLHIHSFPLEGATHRNPKPFPQLLAAAETELRKRVPDMKLYGVRTDASPPCDLAIRHAVLDRMRDGPLGWRQYIVMGWSAAA